MLILNGYSALSNLRKQQFLNTIQKTHKSVKSIEAQFIHFVDISEPLTIDENDTLTMLLSYGQEWGSANIHGTQTFIIVPRLGTISPWSSKATDIVKNIGLDKITGLERGILFAIEGTLTDVEFTNVKDQLHDKMVNTVLHDLEQCSIIFDKQEPTPLTYIDVLKDGVDAIKKIDTTLGLALNEQEIEYLNQSYIDLGRNPTDVELYMFAQANSEHCRHKIFNASWSINEVLQDKSLFDMIRNTTKSSPDGVLSAYKDNAAVIKGSVGGRFYPDPKTNVYGFNEEPVDILIKVETHNHPTAISPHSGAATGVGGEIRDEGATGFGAKPKAGLVGFTVSNLNIPNFTQAWEKDSGRDGYGKPDHIVSAFDIMIEAPIGGASYANEFGRPNLTGYLRTYQQVATSTDGTSVYGYHKPIMLAGGMGNIKHNHITKGDITAESYLICLGGPAMCIGLGGSGASSIVSNEKNKDLDFSSVQRDNAEMERRCQEVIDKCWQKDTDNPINFIHDVGAGGISNAFPELVKDGNVGGNFELRNINIADNGMSPLEIWSNESQERYVLSIPKDRLDDFDKIAKRERCPYSVVGTTVTEQHLTLTDSHFDNSPVDLPMDILFGNTPKVHKEVKRVDVEQNVFDTSKIDLSDAIDRILSLPTVASKGFLITIGDRSITGMVARDQMVGPWQVPVADCAVTTTTLNTTTGEAMALGERSPLAIIDAAASGRMAVGEAITNLAGAYIENISDIRLSANWMVASGHSNEDEKLYDTVKTIGMDFCPELGIAIPVGKDSMSMRTIWNDDGTEKSVTSPLSVVITGFTPVLDTNKTLTPQILTNKGDTSLILLDLSAGKNRMGASCLAQVYNQIGTVGADIDAKTLKAFFCTTQKLNGQDKLLAYHDRSDGGLFVSCVEMAFAGKTGITLNLTQDLTQGNIIDALFSEELGGVIQVRSNDIEEVLQAYTSMGVSAQVIGVPNASDKIIITNNDVVVYENSRVTLQRLWSCTSYNMQALRDNVDCAKQEFDSILDTDNPGLHTHIPFDLNTDIIEQYINTGAKPKIAVLREQGVNGQVEMAGAFTVAGFGTADVHMTDLHSGHVKLKDFDAFVACGGFSYGDVLGAGGGWAKNILFTPHIKEQFETFFARNNTLALGVCNGCQMMAQLKTIIPGAENWPKFIKNISEQFEARTNMVEISKSDSIWFNGMTGTRSPIAIAHGEGRVMFENEQQQKAMLASNQVALRFVDGYGNVTENYPANPNGSIDGVTGLTALDGRVQIMMPHPERVYRSATNSWVLEELDEYSAWMQMFKNARRWLG